MPLENPIDSNPSNPFVRRFPGDPDIIRTLADIETVERIPVAQRFPVNSTRDAIALMVARHADETALSFLPNGNADDTPQQWTYAQYGEEIIAAANLFDDLGLKENESVAFLLPNVPEMVFGIWAAQAVGIAAPINPFLQAEQIAGIAKEADARLLVTLGPEVSDDYWQKALAAQRHAPSIKHIITVGGATQGTLDWAEATARQPRDRFRFERSLSGSETASYFHTGGTTGTPKLACHTHRAEVVNVCQMQMTGVSQSDLGDNRTVILCGLPLFHVNAVFVSALSAIMAGGELVLAGTQGFREKALIEGFWPIVQHYRVTSFAGVPTVYAALLEQSSTQYDLSSLICGGCGAAPMPVNLLRDFRERTGADIIEGYGMTETSVAAITHYYYGERKIGAIGMRLPYLQVRVVQLNQDGGVERDCETDEIGVLLMKGPNVIPHYKQTEANNEAWPEPGWLNSGDLGRCDADGYFWLTGRAKDLIIRGGHNIDPMITEDALSGHPDVEMAAAVGKPDAYAGEVPIAFVQLRKGATTTADQLKAFAREHAAERAGAPVQVIIKEDLPKTAVGKLFKPTLRKEAIALAYHDMAQDACPDTTFSVSVEDDKHQGTKVLIQAQASVDDLERLKTTIAEGLNTLAYAWELTGSDT